MRIIKNLLGIPVQYHGKAEVGQGDLHDEAAAHTVNLLEVVVAVQQSQASGNQKELHQELRAAWLVT